MATRMELVSEEPKVGKSGGIDQAELADTALTLGRVSGTSALRFGDLQPQPRTAKAATADMHLVVFTGVSVGRVA
jgi:hypothetical protein